MLNWGPIDKTPTAKWGRVRQKEGQGTSWGLRAKSANSKTSIWSLRRLKRSLGYRGSRKKKGSNNTVKFMAVWILHPCPIFRITRKWQVGALEVLIGLQASKRGKGLFQDKARRRDQKLMGPTAAAARIQNKSLWEKALPKDAEVTLTSTKRTTILSITWWTNRLIKWTTLLRIITNIKISKFKT